MRVALAEAETRAGRVAVDPAIGNLRRLAFVADGRRIEPLHAAPWLDEPPLAEAVAPPVERFLSGDFLCAPFGLSDVEEAPPHGWPANSAWSIVETGSGQLRLALDRPVMGARIGKTVRLSDDAPLLFQEHLIEGGEGGLTVAHHPMIRLAGRGRLSTSPKRAALTPVEPLEPGRHRLTCPARAGDLSRFPAADGGTIDLADLPVGDRHEDFATLIEAAGSALGWTAIVREVEDDVVFFVKDPAVLPVTMLWHSNGGRDHAPWNGRHKGVLGVEDGCAAGAGGHRAALGPNPVAAEGVPTSLPLAPGRSHRIAHVIGAIPRPAGWTEVADIRVHGPLLTLSDVGGGAVDLPFPDGFLKGGA